MLLQINRGLEKTTEYLVFAARWLQAPIYLGLIVGSTLYVYKFLQELLTLFYGIQVFTEVQVMLAILGLIDISMVINLAIIVIIGGYSIFTSRIDFEGKEDRPQWLDHLDADRLKVKLSSSLASISGVHLLKTFIDIHSETRTGDMAPLRFEIGIHMVFIVSSLVLAWIVKILQNKNEVGERKTLIQQLLTFQSTNLGEIITSFRQGKATAKSHIKNLIAIAAADGKFTESELILLENIARRNNITPDQLRKLRQNQAQITFKVPKDEIDRFHQLYDLILMMSADKNIHADELRLCELYAVKFGYRKETAKEMIEFIRVNIEEGNDPEETLKQMGNYVNVK
jgi:uncharacterized protein (TIGR00645 family)